MPQLKVNFITNKSDNGAPEISFGATVPSGKSISGAGGMNIVGVLTATSFSGDGTGLAQFSSAPKAFAVKLILDPLPFRS